MMASVLESLPVAAILRGVKPSEVVSIGQVPYDGGIRSALK